MHWLFSPATDGLVKTVCPAVSCAMLQLETAATAGVVLVLGLIALLAAEAFNSRFPAIQDGSLPLWSLKVDGHLPEAFAVVGYAFYMQVRAAGVLHVSCLYRAGKLIGSN